MDQSRRDMAVKAAEGLLDELEAATGPVISGLMKGQRLARLLRDTDGQTWLDLECRGYPDTFASRTLGSAEKYARAGGRVAPNGNFWRQSLPQIEALQANAATMVQGYKVPPAFSPSVSSSNPHELVSLSLGSTATKLQNDFLLQRKSAFDAHEHWTKVLCGIKSALHSYGTDCLYVLLFGNQMEGLFEQARTRVEQFVRDRAPQAAQQVVASVERFNDGDPESLSHSLTSCRRLLQTVADAVFPPSETPFTDAKGKQRKVGKDEYKNRLIAFVEQKVSSSSSARVLSAESELTVARLDALYEKVCKGVHAEVEVPETRLVLMSTYMLLSEVAELAAGGSAAPQVHPAPAPVMESRPAPAHAAKTESDERQSDAGSAVKKPKPKKPT